MAIFRVPPPTNIGGNQPFAPTAHAPPTAAAGSITPQICATPGHGQTAAIVRSTSHAMAATNAQSLSRTLVVAIIRSAVNVQARALATAALHLRALAATSAQSARLTTIGAYQRTLSAVDAQVVSILRQAAVIRHAANAQTVAKALAVSRTMAAINAQAVALIRQTLAVRSATNAQALSSSRLLGASRLAQQAQSVARILLVSITRKATDAQVVSDLPAGLHPRSFATTDGQSSSLIRLTAIIRSATNASAASIQVLVAIIRSATNAQNITPKVSVAVIRGAIDVQVAARVVLVSVIRATTSARVANLIRLTAIIRGAYEPLVAGGIARPAKLKSVGAIQTESPSMVRQTGHLINVTSAQSARLVKTVATILAVASTQVVALINTTNLRRSVAQSETVAANAMRTFIRSFNAVSTESTRLLRSIGHILSASTIEAVRLVRLSSIGLSVATAQSLARLLNVPKRLATTSALLASANAMRTFNRAFATTDTQSVRLIKLTGRLIVVASGAIVAGVRSVGAIRFMATPQSLALVRQIGWRTALAQTSSVALRVGRLLFVNVLASLLQIVFGSAALGTRPLVVNVASPSAAAMTRGYPRTYAVISQSIVSLAALLHRFLPLSQRRRVVRLPTPQQAVTLPPANRRVRLPDVQTMVMLPPSVRRVTLPEEVDDMSDYEIIHPEPAYFSPFDPTDQEQFTFDWSKRGYPGDTIVFASVVSIPPGLNIVGPAFIDGQLVEVTLGPMTVPLIQPAQYALRCMAVFHSGRISNYSIPIQIRSL